MVFQTPNFEMNDFLDFTSEQGVEVRTLDILDEDVEEESMIESTLSFHENYNIVSFFKKLKSDYHLKSVKLRDRKK